MTHKPNHIIYARGGALKETELRWYSASEILNDLKEYELTGFNGTMPDLHMASEKRSSWLNWWKSSPEI